MRINRKNLIGMMLVMILLAGSSEVSLAASETDSVKPGPARDWGSIIEIPSDQEIAEFNKRSVDRSPYLSGWLGIDSETRFLEYSIDFKADHIPYGTYFSCANIRMDRSSLEQKYDDVHTDEWLSFYAGIQMRDPERGSSSIMSFWDIYCKDKDGEDLTIRAKLVYPENTKANVFTNEGDGVNYKSEYTWEQGCWYRMLLQCVRSEENDHTLVQQWICNLETGEWTKMCCYDTGIAGSCFMGDTAVFLENYMTQYAGDIRSVEFKNIRIRPLGSEEWVPVSQVSMIKENYPGSFCFGADNEQFWMISTGLENRSIVQSGERNTYQIPDVDAIP